MEKNIDTLRTAFQNRIKERKVDRSTVIKELKMSLATFIVFRSPKEKLDLSKMSRRKLRGLAIVVAKICMWCELETEEWLTSVFGSLLVPADLSEVYQKAQSALGHFTETKELDCSLTVDDIEFLLSVAKGLKEPMTFRMALELVERRK